MRWSSAVTQKKTAPEILQDLTQSLEQSWDSSQVDLCLVFLSPSLVGIGEELVRSIQARFNPRVLLGCTGGGIVGGSREVEGVPAVSVTLAHLPGVTLSPFRIADSDLPDLDVSPKAWQKLFNVSPQENPQFVVLADPFSIRAENLLLGLDYAYPKSIKVGGLASGSSQPGENALYYQNACYRSGAIGLAMFGNIAMEVLVAQGCRPIGRPMRVTQCERNILKELDGENPLFILRDLYRTLGERDQNLLQHALFLGLVMDSMKTHHTQGDFLVRNIVGLDTEKGFLAVGALLRQGQMVQFHLRDANTSVDDLNQILKQYKSKNLHDQISGALLFSCLGRGQYLYGVANHDTDTFQKELGPIPVSGFFCNGEIGPVSGTTYLHGYTSCFVLMRPQFAPISNSVQFPTSQSHPVQPPLF